MEMTKNFIPAAVENKWYAHWMEKGYFKSTPDNRTPFTITMPPPNVTGYLHMGHTLNCSIQDILIRYARMHGKNACWVPGMDHASIATEAKVVALLREKGIKKSDLSRDEFLKYAWEWKEKYGGIILQQLKKLGCSPDWDRTTFTLDENYSKAVFQTFVYLYKQGLIYRGVRMIHWDVKAKTALSDEEVIYKEVQSKLYYIKYKVDAPGEEYLQIATVRPETILGDTAICVNPHDERYFHMHGKYVFVPLINRRIPVITDEYVDMEFGTGALKITPAHDINDYQIGMKHNLEVIDVLNEDGTMSDAAQLYVGMERFEAREKISEALEAGKHLAKVSSYTNQIGFSERTNVVVEPRLSKQWWVSMKNLATPAMPPVLEDIIRFFPAKYKNLYRHWMENIKDWCISRQLWWGHRIPAWYDEYGNIYVAENEAQLASEYPETVGKNLIQDEDVLDTWFSSWLWPMEVFKGISQPGNKDFNYYYPTNILVTAPEIIFFWVARMIMAGYAFKDEQPFKDVYFTGIVRDKEGKKMSKSLGNSPDLLALVDSYGADAVRFGIIVSSPAGNDLLFDVSSLEQGRNFNNKIWNVAKLLQIWKRTSGNISLNQSTFAIQWFEQRLWECRKQVEEQMKQYQISEALKTIYSLIWDDFCSWYIEWVKPAPGAGCSPMIWEMSMQFMDELLQLLHPFMPFITEEIYHSLQVREDDLCVKQFKESTTNVDHTILQNGFLLKKIITAFRDTRNKQKLKPKENIHVYILTENKEKYKDLLPLMQKQLFATAISFVTTPPENTIVLTIEDDRYYIETEHAIESDTLKADLIKDLDYQKNFLLSVEKKLANEKFMQNAKVEIIALEQKKRDDALARIHAIEESLKLL